MWIELFREAPDAARTYAVIDPTGKAKGNVTMPQGTTLLEAGRDYVLGIRRDHEGLEHVVQYTLTRR